MLSVGLAMILKDEPLERVAMLVEFLRPVVSEFSIVDTGSRNIEQVRVSLSSIPGVIFNEFEWIDDFAAARNHALSFLSTDLVLHLDADEIPTYEMMKHLLWIQENMPKNVKGYQTFTRNWWGTEWGIEHPAHWHVRLFRREHGRWYKRVHEQVQIDGKPEHQAGKKLERMAKEAYLIHAKPAEKLDTSALLYTKIGE